MEQETKFEVHNGVEVPASPLLRRERKNKYGSIPGLDDEELADPDEIERQVILEELGALMMVPVKSRQCWITPVNDESLGIYWGPFESADFLSGQPDVDKCRYKAQKLEEELKDLLLLMEISKAHVAGNAKYAVLRYLEQGVIDIDHIENMDMLILARQYLRARRLQKQIEQLKAASRQRREKAARAWLESAG